MEQEKLRKELAGIAVDVHWPGLGNNSYTGKLTPESINKILNQTEIKEALEMRQHFLDQITNLESQLNYTKEKLNELSR